MLRSLPRTPNCHNTLRDTRLSPHILWKQPDPPGTKELGAPTVFRHCSECGSIHPEDLMNALISGAYLTPYRIDEYGNQVFWVNDIPHARENELINTTSMMEAPYGDGYKATFQASITQPMGKAQGIWSNIHIDDQGFDSATYIQLLRLIVKNTRDSSYGQS